MLKEMFKKRTLTPQEKKQAERVKKAKDTLLEYQAPEGLFQKCSDCGKPVYNEDIIENYYICPHCGNYFRIRPRTRIAMVLDRNTFEEWDTGLATSDPLEFPGYLKKLEHQKSVTNLEEAVITGKGKIGGSEAAIAVMSADFMMGSMGQVVGEKITRAIERATDQRIPIIIFMYADVAFTMMLRVLWRVMHLLNPAISGGRRVWKTNGVVYQSETFWL